MPNRPEHIPGYEHPENINSNRDSLYSTFTEGEKTKNPYKNYGNNPYSQYANYNSLQQQNEEKCPVCSSDIEYKCPCAHSDKKCKNGHIWYTNRCGDIINGDPHKNK